MLLRAEGTGQPGYPDLDNDLLGFPSVYRAPQAERDTFSWVQGLEDPGKGASRIVFSFDFSPSLIKYYHMYLLCVYNQEHVCHGAHTEVCYLFAPCRSQGWNVSG